MADVPTGAPTESGLAPNVAGALAYVLGPITGILFMVIEKHNAFVRFHAAQSIVVGVASVIASIALSVLSTVLAVIPILGWIAAFLLWLALGFGFFVLWIVLMVRAYRGREWEVPGLGKYARQLLASVPITP